MGLERPRKRNPKSKLEYVVFGAFTSDEIKKLSVIKITTPLTFTPFGHTLPGGLYDPALGPMQYGAKCSTCSGSILQCPGHMGHIELPLPVINPLFRQSIITFLSCSCLNCHNILLPEGRKSLLIRQLQLLDKGLVTEALDIEQLYNQLLLLNNGLTDVAFCALVTTELNKACELSLKEVKTVEEWKQGEVLRSQFINNTKQFVHKGNNCPKCKKPWRKLKTVKNGIAVEARLEVASKFKGKSTMSDEVQTKRNDEGYIYIMPSEAMEFMRKIWRNDESLMKEIVPLLKTISGPDPTDIFFMSVIPVTPINIRPIKHMDDTVVEHPQNNVYKTILQDCVVIRSIILLMNNDTDPELENDSLLKERMDVINKLNGSNLSEKLQFSWQELQSHVGVLLDKSSRDSSSLSDSLGLKQLIEKKEGIIRMHMMGKRVNFAARSVITPDPYLNIDEIGIPDIFAKKLTYPVPVTPWNVTELRKMVINGPDIHPGAVFVENDNGFVSKIPSDDVVAREGIAKTLLTPGESGPSKKTKIIHRHLLNGDALLLNRQPTLHRPSIMAHKARILKGDKTLRLHYSNCKAYNADFDGDEMNAHFPQNELARSEAYNIVSVSKQYLVPKDGTPLGGLIQDHVISGVRLTMRDSFFNREDYMNMVFQALSFIQGDIKLLPPAVLKPEVLWSGKQILSTVLINLIPKGKKPLNLTSSAKISYKAWEKGPSRPWLAGGTPFSDPKVMTEGEVVIRGGELLCGVLDKTHYGATPYSLVHCVNELYGGSVSSQLLSSFSKLFINFLQLEGFTLGVEDILVVKDADKERSKYIKSLRKIGKEVAARALDLTEETSVCDIKSKIEFSYRKNHKFRALLDHQYKKCLDTYTNNINKSCLPYGLLSPFPANNLQLMVQSGAKGSTVNTMQISCLLGQIELEGKRPPIMLSGRSLPSFPPYDLSPRAGGFIDGRFMTGIQPQEFFFHCMAGREGLIDTAVKTSRSGYLQRCLVKHLEGLTVRYDLTVRDSDDTVVQFRYGEDAMEVMKSQFLNKEQMPFLAENLKNILNKKIIKQLKAQSDVDFIASHSKKMKQWRKKHLPRRTSGFTLFSQEMTLQQSQKNQRKINKNQYRTKAAANICRMWQELDLDVRNSYEKKARKCPDPLVSHLQPDAHFHSISEKLDTIMNEYLMQYNITGKLKDDIKDMISLKSSMSVCSPGEPVGLVAAQSVGEPSTQMTLNTFHFAGRGEMNVTLGIPRLREILMLASKNIRTPSMEVPFLSDVIKLKSKAEKLRKSMTRVTVADVLEYIEVREHLDYESVFRNYTYQVHFQFLPRRAYKHDNDMRPKQILRHIERKFINEVVSHVFRRCRVKKELVTSKSEKETVTRSRRIIDGDYEDREIDAKEPSSEPKVAADDSSDGESVADDEDATAERRRMRQQEEQEYQDPEEGEEGDPDSNDESDKEEVETPAVGEEEQEDRLREVQSLNSVRNYKFDTEGELWCEVTLCLPVKLGRVDLSTLLRELASKSIVYEVPGIRRAFTCATPSGDGLMLKTDGLNMAEIFHHRDLLDINCLYSNDVHAMAAKYGIEAATKVIVKEVQNVFRVYGITVDPRHLLLIADYMTFDGTFQPLNRTGMEGGNSPLQQISFESALKFLKNAVTSNRKDKLSCPSACLIVGQPIQCGTNSFKLMHKIA